MTEGARPLTWQSPKLEIAGREYTVRRLGLMDIQRVARIYAAASTYAQRAAIANVHHMGATEIGAYVLDFVPHALDEVIDFIASVLSIPAGKPEEKLKEGETNAGTIRDPDIFPVSAAPDVIQALLEHEDVVSFFESVLRLVKSPTLKNLTGRLSEQSTASKRGTGGPTRKS